MKKLLFSLFVAVFVATNLFASDIEVDGIWYDIDDTNLTASVTYKGSSSDNYSNEYTGSVVIPTSITYNNKTYSVTTIGKLAFYKCIGLTLITIPNSITTIENEAFEDCEGLTSVTIPNSVTTIGNYAFYYCSGLTKTNYTGTIADWCKIKFENFYSNPNSYSHHFFINDVEITNLVIPNSVTTIRDYAFTCCDGLTSLTIPRSVTMIGQEAFFNCPNLTSVTIGNSVTTIGEWAFEYCTGLTSITCYAINPPICEGYCFNLVDISIPLYVPAQSVDAYQQADEWKDFTNILPIAAEEVPVTDPVITPDNHSVTITWPQTDNADTYTLETRKNGELVCTLTFNSQGVMTDITFAAPARGGERTASNAELTTNGYKFTVTGLEPGTEYTYAVTAKNAFAQPIQTYSGSFKTTDSTGLENLTIDKKVSNKFIYGNQLYLRRGDKIYNAAGGLIK